jgi:hypothetical protein
MIRVRPKNMALRPNRRPGTAVALRMAMKLHRSIFIVLGSVLAACGGTSSSSDPDVATSAAAVVAATTVAPPTACGTDTIASNTSGGAVVLASDSFNGTAWAIEICTTTDGVHWSGPTTVGAGQEVAAAIAPNGRAMLVWEDVDPSSGAYSVQASILPPGGSWSIPVTLNIAYGRPSIKMDGSGNAIALWTPTGTSLDGPVQTAVLAANSSTWGPVVTLAPNGGLATLVGNAAGDVLVTWRTRTTNDIQGAAGTILGGFRPTVTFAITNGYVRNPSVPAINSAGDAVVAFETTRGGTEYATMTPSGTWSAVTQLSSTESLITVVINGAGNFVLTWTATDGGVETLTVI